MGSAAEDEVIVTDESFAARLIAIRRALHSRPELSFEERETTAFIRRQLEEAGIAAAAGYSLETGLIADVAGPHSDEGPVIALRADIDALPIEEATGLPFASKRAGVMHACGHDFHTAAMLGAAFLLKRRERELKGTVRFVFQPGEEKATGAGKVLATGLLDDVRAIYGMHNKPDYPVGTIGIKPGPLMAAADGFVVELEGLGSHAAVPEAGVDPIVAAAHLVTALQSIVSRSVSPLDSAVVSVTQIHSGTTWNVLPDKALLDGTVRTFDERSRLRVRDRFEGIVNGVAAAFGTRAAVRWIDGPPPVDNDVELAEAAARTAWKEGLQVVTPKQSPGGEDFAFYQKRIPGVFVFMGTSGPHGWHHPAFDVDERALPVSARYFAELAISELDRLAGKSRVD